MHQAEELAAACIGPVRGLCCIGSDIRIPYPARQAGSVFKQHTRAAQPSNWEIAARRSANSQIAKARLLNVRGGDSRIRIRSSWRTYDIGPLIGRACVRRAIA